MSNRLYVGNLPYDTTADEVRQAFERTGTVTDVHVPTDRMSGQPRGFAFVTMATADAANQAVAQLDGAELGGRRMRVRVADDRPPPARGGGGGGGGGGGPREGGGGGGRRNGGGPRGGGGGGGWR